MSETVVEFGVDPSTLFAVDGSSIFAISDVVNPANITTPPPPAFAQADYQQVLIGLLPRGRIWPRFLAALQAIVMGAIAFTFVRVSQAAGALIADVFPATAGDMLTEWESSLGLPDPCAGPAPTIAARRLQVVQKLINPGGQSVPYFIQLAATLGYTITIDEFTGANAFLWRVNCPQVQQLYSYAGQSFAGEYLVTGGAAVLECVLNELKPGHTTLEFAYG